MKKSDPRFQALKKLCQKEGFSSDLPSFASIRDRALYQELFRGVIRNRLLLDWYLKHFMDRPIQKVDPKTLNVLRLGLYQIFFMRVPDHAAVSETVELLTLSKNEKAKAFVNAILRNILRARDQGNLPSPSPFDWALRFSYPEMLYEHLKQAFDWAKEPKECFGDFLKSLNRPLPICIRVHRLKTNRERLQKKIEAFDPSLTIEKTPFSPDGLLLFHPSDLTKLPGYPEGEFLVQSESSQLISHLLAPLEPPFRILDACAAPGGKTTHLAELQGDQGEIVALAPSRRQSEKSQRRIHENIERLGFQSIQVIPKTAEEYAQGCAKESFDRILIDAPCTGLGTLAKHPERKWLFKKHHVEKLRKQQESIFQAVFPLLKKEGILVYSVCSLSLPEWQVGLGKTLRLPSSSPSEIPWQPFYHRNHRCFLFWPHKIQSEGLFGIKISK